MQVSRIRSLRPNILVVDLASFGADGQGMLNAIRPRLVEVPTILLLAKGHAGARGGGEMCIKEVWKTDFLDDTRTLDVHVRWLRLKIEDDPSAPCILCTERGVGYRLAAAEPPEPESGEL